LTMRIVVCAKMVPDPIVDLSLDENFHLNRTGKTFLDEADTYGIETALRLAGETDGGEVIIVSMGAGGDVAGIRSALAMGANRAVLVSDDAVRGTDALGTAKVLAAVIGPLEPDLILCATESSDGYTGTMPVQLAELLCLPSITFAKSVRIVDSVVEVDRQTEHGREIVVSPYPCVITVTSGSVAPRYASFKSIMAAKTKPIEIMSIRDLGLSSQVGVSGARQEVFSASPAAMRNPGNKFNDEGNGADRIVSFLESIKIL
jgi:electron transfer flavoprotein beta subunit